MSNEEVENLIDKLTLVTNGQLQIEDIKQIINPNYTDVNGNGCFHFITEYSFEKFCLKNIKLNRNQDIVTFHKYNCCVHRTFLYVCASKSAPGANNSLEIKRILAKSEE